MDLSNSPPQIYLSSGSSRFFCEDIFSSFFGRTLGGLVVMCFAWVFILVLNSPLHECSCGGWSRVENIHFLLVEKISDWLSTICTIASCQWIAKGKHITFYMFKYLYIFTIFKLVLPKTMCSC